MTSPPTPHEPPASPAPSPARRLLGVLSSKWVRFALRWGVFVVGVAWIVSQLTIRDRVNVVMPDLTVQSLALREPATDASTAFYVEGVAEPIDSARVVSRPDRKTVKMFAPGDPQHAAVVEVPLWGLHLQGDLNKAPTVDKLIVGNPAGPGGLEIRPKDVAGGFNLQTPRPIVEKGLAAMIREANPWQLALAIAVFPVTMFLTTLRWSQILSSQAISIPIGRVFKLTLVGNFYNSFLPGSTGGDFAKAYYVSRQTPHKIRAVISVFVDRVIGLLALVILGGTVSAYQYFVIATPGSPTADACARVAAACLVIVLGACAAAVVGLSQRVRRAMRFDVLLARLPMQHHLGKVREAAVLYRAHALQIFWWIAVTFPIHSTVVVSAIIAGRAFGLDIAWPYYFVCVPVMILAAALPISPQGAGVMEGIGFLLLAKQGATVSEVLALTLSIRFVQLLWNLVGGIFVLGGEFSQPRQSSSLDQIADEEEPPEPNTPAITAS